MRLTFAASALLVLLAAGCTSSRGVVQSNGRLTELYEQDQADRRLGDDADWTAITRRDAERRAEVQRLLDTGAVRSAADHYHAAMVFQHGSDSTAYRMARDLAREAEQLGSEPARWLAAAAHDRYLISIGEPQHYGTQFRVQDGTRYVLPLDSTAVSDAERRRVGARTLDEIRAHVAQQNGTETGSLAPPPEHTSEHERAPTVELIGGIEGLVAQIDYPAEARRSGIEGRVRVELTVLPDGSVDEVFVVDGLGHGLDEEALRVVRLARFVNHKEEPWPIRITIPFSL
jgi:TonB family protein